MKQIQAGVPQCVILSPTLFFIYSAEFPWLLNTVLATFADDARILAKHKDPSTESRLLLKKHSQLNKIEYFG